MRRTTLRTGTTLGRLGIAAILCACSSSSVSDPKAEPPGSAKKPDTQILGAGAALMQARAPVLTLSLYLDAFHLMKDKPELQIEAHHYCHEMNEELAECAIFDGSTERANLVGVEYIISERLYGTLDAEEQKLWHPHNYEILSGQLVLPGVPEVAEKAALQKKLNSYGKTWHLWNTGHWGKGAGDALPIGQPMLAWSFNRDGEAASAMVAARDERLGISTDERRRARADLARLAHPQGGVDDLKGKVPGAPSAGTAPEGVRAR